MPIYEYVCQGCGKQTEIIQKLSDSPLTTCESCAGELKKVISRTSFQLKGSGWYATDYKKSGASPSSTPVEAKSEGPAPAPDSPTPKKDS
ncbi:MAG: zinc ribbon domain-containing protein [Deltaproteobacteria bacterium]|nr:zinc ribbon domain-containing protein [Deltaproteobacteria bacterium]MBI3294574.1 zinc ribbon domain-containing protein [Deltaproteobacteria bacterium]